MYYTHVFNEECSYLHSFAVMSNVIIQCYAQTLRNVILNIGIVLLTTFKKHQAKIIAKFFSQYIFFSIQNGILL